MRINTITKISAAKDAIILITLDAIRAKVNRYLGIYTFLINGALFKIEVIALDVASEKKLYIT